MARFTYGRGIRQEGYHHATRPAEYRGEESQLVQLFEVRGNGADGGAITGAERSREQREHERAGQFCEDHQGKGSRCEISRGESSAGWFCCCVQGIVEDGKCGNCKDITEGGPSTRKSCPIQRRPAYDRVGGCFAYQYGDDASYVC